MHVDPSTLARWERGEREPTGTFAIRVLRFLEAVEATGFRVKDEHINNPSNYDNAADCANISENQIFIDSSIAAL
jgi:transcriptional regulator with XRE-family HTH domain